MLCFHGTTETGLNAILNGKEKPISPWKCSDRDGCMYVYPIEKHDDFYMDDLEPVDFDNISNCIIGDAFASAQIQSLFDDSETIYVLELDIDDDLLSDDESCEGVSEIASYIYMGDFDVSMIKNIYACTINKWKKPFILGSFMCNRQINLDDIDCMLVSLADSLDLDSVNWDDLHEFDYTTIEISDLVIVDHEQPVN